MYRNLVMWHFCCLFLVLSSLLASNHNCIAHIFCITALTMSLHLAVNIKIFDLYSHQKPECTLAPRVLLLGIQPLMTCFCDEEEEDDEASSAMCAARALNVSAAESGTNDAAAAVVHASRASEIKHTHAGSFMRSTHAREVMSDLQIQRIIYQTLLLLLLFLCNTKCALSD